MTATVLSDYAHMGGFEVYDAEFDDCGFAWALCAGYPDDQLDVCRYIMAETASLRIVPDEYGCHIVADIAGFVRRNAESLKAFAEAFNRPEYQIDTTETGVWNGIRTIHGLMCENYPPEAYSWLAREWGVQE